MLLRYGEVIRRINARQDFPQQTVIDSAELTRKFIHDYQEKLEEAHFSQIGNYTRMRQRFGARF